VRGGHAAWRDTGGGNPGTTASGRARGRQGKREKGESGGTEQWAGPREWGPAVAIEKKGERVTGGPGFLNLTQIQ
jgi:hypothetical protein